MPKFLIIRFSSIGDIVLTTPVIRCLKQQVKDAEVHYLTKKSFSPIIEHNPFIDKKFFLKDKAHPNPPEGREAGNTLSEVVDELKKEKYDAIIDLHHNLRTASIKLQLGVKSFSFDKLNFEKWLMVNFKINKLPNIHIVDRYMKTIKSFGAKNDGKGLDYFISPEDEKIIQQLPPSHQNGYIGFVIGAKHFTKQLPVEKIIAVCKNISQPIVLLGGKEDFEKGEQINSQLAIGNWQMFNACGKFSLNESAALIKRATKIITHDTGLMHIAAAFKKEIISVWGNTIPEFGMYPYYGNADISNLKFQISNLTCRPCTKIGFDKCPKGHFRCMMETDETEMAKQISK